MNAQRLFDRVCFLGMPRLYSRNYVQIISQMIATTNEYMGRNCSFFVFAIKLMFWVSFSPGRERACRHCWISSYGPPWENGCCSVREDPFRHETYLTGICV